MREANILQHSLHQYCPELHLKRLNSLMLASKALIECKTLTLTELGRNLPTTARTKHNIKRIDRLLGNTHLHQERLAVYQWHASLICSGNPMPIVLVDWSDIREHKRTENWRAVRSTHDLANGQAKSLGCKTLTKTNPINCHLTLYRSKPKGRTNQRSTRTNCHHPSAKTYSTSAKEPWVLASNLPPESRSPKQLVNLYAKRMQIEETFRDLKSPAYGFGLRQSRTNSPERFDIILLIALMVQCLLWLVGLHAQQQGWDKHFQANTIGHRTVLSTIRLGLEVLRRPDYQITEKELLAAWVLFANQLLKYGYAMADL
ncbi:IS4 family transposase [Klebsiella pneumoniae]|uniref:IS4 family transposase n=1 Tax=Klebsiella pneumoniae TaxID=573 RepID=UPI00237F2F2A|nr:IS4 family transposase [Klebsiella pneumoniae]